MEKQQPKINKTALIWRFLEGSKSMFVLSMVMASLMALADMITPQIIRAAVDNAIGGNEPTFGPAVMKLVDAVGGFAYLGQHLWILALAVLVAVLWMPVLRIYGSSMSPTLNEGEIVITMKGDNIHRGDIVGVYYGSKLLIKRCIAVSGEWVNIDEDGTVYVDNQPLDEPYLVEKAFGDCDIKLPYQVPENTIFVMGDHRSVSIDSRNSSVGCIEDENVIGKIIFRIWPMEQFGLVG